MVRGGAKPVFHGPNRTESNLFHHGENHIQSWMTVWESYSRALEQRTLEAEGKMHHMSPWPRMDDSIFNFALFWWSGIFLLDIRNVVRSCVTHALLLLRNLRGTEHTILEEKLPLILRWSYQQEVCLQGGKPNKKGTNAAYKVTMHDAYRVWQKFGSEVCKKSRASMFHVSFIVTRFIDC